MHDTFIDPVRKARKLVELASQEDNQHRLLELAKDLRQLGRADLSRRILDSFESRFKPSRESVIEKALCLEALGYLAEAIEAASDFMKIGPEKFEALYLELRLALRLGGKYIEQFNFRRLFQATQDEKDIKTLLEIIPLHRLPFREFIKMYLVCFRLQGVRSLAVLARFGLSKIAYVSARFLVATVFLLCRLFTSKTIYFSSMNKFARLADLVDRVDPLIRRLKFKKDTPDSKVIIFFFGGYPNKQLFDMYKSHCTFIPATNRVLRKLVFYFIECLKLTGRFTEITTDYRKINADFLEKPPVISFSESECRNLEKQLEEVGIDPEKPFICFGLRDMAYYEYYGDVMKIPLEQQGKRSKTDHRCPPLGAYLGFAHFWAEQGYQVVRMGLRVSQALPNTIHPKIIDYATKNRTDELDAFLFARCWFLIAGDTGLFSGAAAFDQPALVTDLFLIRNTIYSSNKKVRNIFVPKLIRDVKEDRFLTFHEQIYCNHFFSFHDDCDAGGFEIVHNSAEDIIDASQELVDRLSGIFEPSREDAELQTAFHNIYPPDHIGYGSTGIVSSKFLKKYSYLLD